MSASRRFGTLLCGVLVLTTFARHQLRAAEVVDHKKVDKLVAPLIDGDWIYGLAIGLIDEHGTQQLGYGRVSESNEHSPSPHTLFEIGSITKVFTGTILAQMVEDGTVSLDEPVQQLLAHTIIVPKGEREITLLDLSTHSSGLPRMPTNFSPRDVNNPYADYTVEQMGTFLGGLKLTREPGEKSVYSNLGVGLLGHALVLKSGYDYESLVEKTILEPLEMTETRITLDDDDRRRLATGHDFDGNPVANWDIPTLAGAGALRSTTDDMLKFLAANLGLRSTTLDSAIANTHAVHYKNPDQADNDVGLGWMLRRKDGVIWHNGGTGGYSAFAGFNPEKRIGVVVLGNTSSTYVDQIGNRLLTLLSGSEPAGFELPKPIELSEKELDPLVGKYQATKLLAAKVTRDGRRLFLQMTGQPKIQICPTSATHFFCRPVDATIDFEPGDDGKIARLVIHQNGADVPAQRVVEDAKALTK